MNNSPIQRLVELLSRLPGVGDRTALRHVFSILEDDPAYAAALAVSLGELHEKVRRCVRCGNYDAQDECHICRDPNRDARLLCLVARVPDLMAVERAGSFRGRYHVVHGLLAPLEGMGPEKLPLAGLIQRIQEDAVQEVVVATPLSVEGEATALYVAQGLRSTGVRVSRIASGVPHGGELEFTDQVTLGRAFEGRRALE